MEIYIVTEFGCNSTGNDMWTPITHVFTDKEKAYDFYNSVSPDLEDKYNISEKEILPNGECIKQISGYLYGNGNCSKRPFGAVITSHDV